MGSWPSSINDRALPTASSVLTIWLAQKKKFGFRRLQWRDSGKASLSSHHSRRQKKALIAWWVEVSRIFEVHFFLEQNKTPRHLWTNVKGMHEKSICLCENLCLVALNLGHILREWENVWEVLTLGLISDYLPGRMRSFNLVPRTFLLPSHLSLQGTERKETFGTRFWVAAVVNKTCIWRLCPYLACAPLILFINSPFLVFFMSLFLQWRTEVPF